MNYNEPREQPAPSMMQLRKDFVYRLSSFVISRGQFTIVEDLPVTKPIRCEKKVSIKTGKPYEVYKIRVKDGNFEGDLEMFKFELPTLAIVFPNGLANYKGSTLAYDGSRWIYVSGEMPAPSQPAPAPIPQLDQRDQYVEQLVMAMKGNDAANQGCTAADMFNYCKNITNGDALNLIMYAKTKGAIYEQGGLYKAV